MEHKWLTSRHAFTLVFLFCCYFSPRLQAHAAELPTIEVAGGITNTTIVTFQNGTHIVVSKNVSSIILHCNASYPVMWSLDSLEQPWATGTRSDRMVKDFYDTSTYKYSMTVALGNHKGYPYAVQLSLDPEEHVCHAVQDSSTLTTKMTVIWEGKLSTWNQKHNKYENGSYQVYWKENSEEILIPCYTLNMKRDSVELYKREPNQTVWFLASDNGTISSFARFEKYVGFFLKPSVVQSEKEMYECHQVLSSNSRSKRETSEEDYSSGHGSGEGPSPKMIASLIDDDYVYIGSEEDLLGWGPNKTKNLTEPQPTDTKDTIVPGSISSVSFSLIRLNASMYQDDIHSTKKPDSTEDSLSTYLNRHNPSLTIDHNDTSISCCINSGYNSSYTSDHMVLYHKWCTEPLMCLTTKHLMKKTYILYYAKYDHVSSTKCRHVNTSGEYATTFAGNPALYVCHMRTDRQVTRYGYNGDYDLRMHQNRSENSYFLKVDSRATYTTLQYYNQSSYSYLSDISKIAFYEGEAAQFRCHGNGFYYAIGFMWELHWKNGTKELQLAGYQPGYYSTYGTIKLNLTSNLEKLSCHVPFWNSSEWVTQSVDIKVQASRAPTSASGESSIEESVEFYAGDSKVLNCDLQGHPPATYRWTLSSSVYNFLERTPIYYSTYSYYSRTRTPSSYREPTTPNVTVSLYAANYVENSTLPIPVEIFTCIASNAVGSASKRFRVRGIRTVKPEIAHGTREITVLFVHDENKSLNCTILNGLPFPEFHWEKHDTNISTTNDHYEIQVLGNSSILTFKSVEYQDEGDYKCVASNMAGNGFREFSVRVRDRPHSRYWYEFAIFLLTLVLILLFASLAYIYVVKSKKINSLKLRAEYSNLFGRHESRITVATLDE